MVAGGVLRYDSKTRRLSRAIHWRSVFPEALQPEGIQFSTFWGAGEAYVLSFDGDG